MDFVRLLYPERFEELCKQILRLEFGNVLGVDGRGGDQGTDSFKGTILKQEVIFQFKFFPNKLDKSRKRKIIESLTDSYTKNPNEWYLLVPANLTIHDWKWWELLKDEYKNVKLTIWDAVILQEKILKHQNKLSVEFTELFPLLEMSNKVGDELYTKFQNDLINIGLSDSNLELINTYSKFSQGNKECWNNRYFSIDDIKMEYDVRRQIIDDIIISIEDNRGTIIFGKSYSGKSILLKRIILEEIERGYIVLNSDYIKGNRSKLKLLLEKLNFKNINILFVLDNIHYKGNEEIFKFYNGCSNNRNIKFLFASRPKEFKKFKELLNRDEASEIETAMQTIKKFELNFTKNDAISFLKKLFDFYDKKHENVEEIAVDIFNKTRGDLLLFNCAILEIIHFNQKKNNLLQNCLERDFNENKSKLDNCNLWKTATYCLLLGSFGIKIDSSLLEKCNIYTNDLVELTKISFLFKVGNQFTIRHEKWGIEFLKYIIKNFFDGSINSFYQQNYIKNILDCISKNFDAHDIIIFFTRCGLLLKSEDFTLGKILIENFNLYDNISNPEKSEIYCYGFGNFYYEIGNYQSAISSFEKSLEFNYNQIASNNNLGNVYFKLRNYDQAIIYYNNAITINENNSLAYYNKGKVLVMMNKFTEALEYFEKSIKLDPGYIYGYLERGNTFLLLDRNEEAIKDFNHMLMIEKDNIEALVNLGSSMLKINKPFEAFSYFGKIKKINQNIAEIWYLEAMTFLEMKMYYSSIPSYEKALAFEPNNLMYKNALGTNYALLFDYKNAEKYFDEVLSIDMYDIIAVVNKAIIRHYQNDNFNSLRYFARAFSVITDQDRSGFRKALVAVSKKILKINSLLIDDDLLLYFSAKTINKNFSNEIEQIMKIHNPHLKKPTDYNNKWYTIYK